MTEQTKRGRGRPPNAQNKVSFGAKQNLGEVFNRMGGVTGLFEWAQENPTEFYRIWAQKLIPNAPTDVHLTGSTEQTVVHRFVLAPLEPAEKVIEHSPDSETRETLRNIPQMFSDVSDKNN